MRALQADGICPPSLISAVIQPIPLVSCVNRYHMRAQNQAQIHNVDGQDKRQMFDTRTCLTVVWVLR